MNKRHRFLLLKFDRTLAQGLIRQVIMLVGLLIVIFLISTLLLHLSGHDWIQYCKQENISKWVLPFYLLIVPDAFDSFCRSDTVGALPVFFACLIYILGVVVFTGMIISVMTNMIERRVENHLDGHIHYLESGHYVIMGYDDIIPSFINHIFQKDKEAYVLNLTSANVAAVTEKLNKSFSMEQMKHIIVNYGHRTTMEDYKDIHLESSEQIFVVGWRAHSAHDAINVECVDSICKYLKQTNAPHKPKSITCVFNDLDTYAAFKTTNIFGEVTELGMEFLPYNFYTEWAKQVFVKRYHVDMGDFNNRYNYPAVFGNGIGLDDPKFVHLVFVGTTNFAVAFAMEAAQVLHFPNFNKHKELRTRITFIDLHADVEKEEFITRNRHFFEVQSYRYQDLSEDATDPKLHTYLADPILQATGKDSDQNIPTDDTHNFLDVEFEFIKGNVFSQKIQNEISKWATSKDEYLSIFLAMANQHNNFVMGMNMPDEVYENKIPVFIRQDLSDNFVTNLRKTDDKEILYYTFDTTAKINDPEKKHGRYANIYPFGMNETVYTADEKSLKRAKLINYLYNTADYTTNKFTSLLVLASIPTEKIWQEADEQWSKLSAALKWSNLYNSYTIRTKMASLRAIRKLELDDYSRDTDQLTEYEVEELAKVEHNRWNVEKLLMGYRRPRPEEDYFEAQSKGVKEASVLKKNKKLFIHHDIRPFEKLDDVKELDYEIARYMPWILEMTEKKQ